MSIFVTIDGVDGVGKTTTCKALAEALNAVYFKSPSSPFDEMRAAIDKEACPLTRYYFYRAAVQHDSRAIAALLKEGKSVVCDRYMYSTYAFHAAMDPRVENIFETMDLVMPDYSILLSATPDIRWQRISERFEDQSYDKHLERNIALQNAASAIFQSLEMIEVDTSHQDVNGVLTEILSKIQSDGGGT